MDTLPVPSWLKQLVGQKKAALRNEAVLSARASIAAHALHTVCQAAQCPNQGECFNSAEATFMVLGDRCTRGCRFCAVERQRPLPPDETEPIRVAQTVKEWGLRYAVLTMPTRDDLPDGGAAHFARVIEAIHAVTPNVKVEPLISDLGGRETALQTILASRPDVLAHNVETVPQLYSAVRIGADFKRSLAVLERAKKIAPSVVTKSGFMVGLGETDAQIRQLLRSLREVAVDLVTIGQYLAPSKAHYPVVSYPEPIAYREWEQYALSIGFKAVASGPLVRSSYRAGALYARAKGFQGCQTSLG